MSFSDPQSVTINAVATSLPRTVSPSPTSNAYRSSDGLVTLVLGYTENGTRKRISPRLNFKKVAADPFAPSMNKEYTGSVYMVIDAPIVGFTNTELKNYVKALRDWAIDATVDKVLGGEI